MYTRPGFEEVPLGKALVDWSAELYAQRGGAGSSFESSLRGALVKDGTGLGRAGRFLSSIALEELVCVTSDAFPIGSSQQRALAHLLTRWFYSMGLVKEVPAFIDYRSSPRLTIDDCVDRLLTSQITLPPVSELGGERATVEAFAGLLPLVIRNLYSLRFVRAVYADRIQRAVADIGWKVASGGTLDQFEKTLFLAYANPVDPNSPGHSRYLAAASSQGNSVGQGISKGGSMPLKPVQNSDANVTQLMGALRSLVEPGPFLRFGVAYSNARLEQLLVYFGPHVSTLTAHTGYTVNFGGFQQVHVYDSESYTWTLEDQEAAIREGIWAYSLGMGDFILSPPQVVTGGPAAPVAPSLPVSYDLPSVNLSLERGYESDCTQVVAEWFSQWRDRTVSNDQGFTPQSLLLDLAVVNRQLGEGLVGETSVASYKFVDPHQRTIALTKRGGDTTSTNFSERIWLPDSKTKAVRPVDVDMTMLYAKKGAVMFPPAFTEFVWIPIRELFTPQPEAESFIIQRLGLTREAAAQSLMAIRISHNSERLKRVLGTNPRASVPLMAAALSGFTSDTGGTPPIPKA